MAKSMDIPQDIIDNVIAVISDDAPLLKKCSLVSSSFLIPSRKHLFSKIRIKSERSCQGIHQLLVRNPFIQPCVKTITLDGNRFTDWVHTLSLLDIFGLPFRCLERFSITVPRYDFQWDSMDWNDALYWDWNFFSDRVKDALWNIMLSPTLKTLSIDGIVNLPISFFLHIAPLTTLDLDALTPNDFTDEYSSLLTRPYSNGAIDRCVWRFGEEHAQCLRTQWIFLPFIYRIRSLEVHIDLSTGTEHDFHILAFFILSLCISIPYESILEHLEFNIRFHDFESDAYTFYENLRNIWSPLDFVTHSTNSQLKRVNINIDYLYREENEEEAGPVMQEISRAVQDGLPLLQVRGEGILFVRAAELPSNTSSGSQGDEVRSLDSYGPDFNEDSEVFGPDELDSDSDEEDELMDVDYYARY